MQLILYFITPHSFMTHISATIKTIVQKMLNHTKFFIYQDLTAALSLDPAPMGSSPAPACVHLHAQVARTPASHSRYFSFNLSVSPDVTTAEGRETLSDVKGLSHVRAALLTDRFQDLARGEGIFRNDRTAHEAGWRILSKRIFIGLFWRFDQCTAQ